MASQWSAPDRWGQPPHVSCPMRVPDVVLLDGESLTTTVPHAPPTAALAAASAGTAPTLPRPS